ncbi:MAG: universal stress protein [Pseudomonadota bacterium]
MYKRILVPLALDHGLSPTLLEIARRLLLPGGEVVALHVVEAAFGLARATQSDAHAQRAFDRARALMKEKLLDEDEVTGHVVEGHVYRSIVEFASERDIGCIVVGSHKPELSDYLLGSTAANVVRHAPCAVHVHR